MTQFYASALTPRHSYANEVVISPSIPPTGRCSTLSLSSHLPPLIIYLQIHTLTPRRQKSIGRHIACSENWATKWDSGPGLERDSLVRPVSRQVSSTQNVSYSIEAMLRFCGEAWKHSTWQKTVLTRSAITTPKVNGFG